MATAPARRVSFLVQREFPDARVDSNVVCRTIAGTTSWSQHAWGNALDIFGPPDALERIYRGLAADRARYDVRTLCYRGRGGCTTPHDDHVHVDFNPKGTGTPPCAGGSDSLPDDPIDFDDIAPDLPPDVADDLPIPSNDPFTQGVSGVVGAVTSVPDFLRFLADPQTWLRIVFILIGLGALAFGVWTIITDVGLRSVVQDVAGAATEGATDEA